jgi:hypothetical protein
MTTNNYKTQAQKAARYLRDEIDDNPASFFAAILILIVLCSLFLKVLFINAEPFLILVGADVPKPSGYPIIGWGFDVLNMLYVGTGGVLLWGLVQLAETTWILVAMDRKAHRVATRESQKELEYQEAHGTDSKSDRHIRKMRRRAVKLPFFFQGASGYIALGAFVFDIIVNWRAYPLFSDFDAFTAGLTIGDFSPIDWDNAMRQFWNLFSVEILVVAIIAVGQWVWMHKQPD